MKPTLKHTLKLPSIILLAVALAGCALAPANPHGGDAPHTAAIVPLKVQRPVLGLVLGVIPALIPILFIGLHVLVSVIQAYVFAILPAVYIGMATADEH